MDYVTDADGCPICPTCGIRLDGDCAAATCAWLSDTDFPADRLNEDGEVIPAR